MENCSAFLSGLKVADRACFFDKLAVRTDRALTSKQLSMLRANADSVDIRHGRPIRGSKNALLLTIVNVSARGLQFIAEHPGYVINYVEVALDIILPDAKSTGLLRDLFDSSFVQGWHGRHRRVMFEGGSYNGQRRPGRSYCWYIDRASKRTHDKFCFHLEGRHQGVEAVRRLGIHEPGDLLGFDHRDYWERNLALYELDRKRFERKLHKSDARTRHILSRAVPGPSSDDEHYFTMQRFVDGYGKQYVNRIDVSVLLPAIDTSFVIYPTNRKLMTHP